MRLLDAILDANLHATAGQAPALAPADFASSLPLVALTCIDARLNHLVPEALGVPESHFIWLRNAGNIITGPAIIEEKLTTVVVPPGARVTVDRYGNYSVNL